MAKQDRATCWSVTINNPTPQDEEYIALARQKGWKVAGQLEKGAQGTPHYQLSVKTPQVRFSQVKKAFPRAHIEAARNVAALQLYVEKNETRIGSLSVQSQFYPSLSKYWELIWKEIEDDPVLHSRVSSSGAIFKDYVTNVLYEATRKLIRKGYFVESMACNPLVISQWNHFHSAIHDRILSHPPVDRQTDRQDELFSQTVDIPTTNGLSSSLQEEADSPSGQEDDDERSSQSE